jgi:hypothetical protein
VYPKAPHIILAFEEGALIRNQQGPKPMLSASARRIVASS